MKVGYFLLILMLANPAWAEVEGFYLQEGDELVVQCTALKNAPIAKPKKMGRVDLCPYENTECKVESKQKQIFFNGTVTIRCPSIHGACPILQKCASDKFTVAEREALSEDISSSNDPNLMQPSGSGIFGPANGSRRLQIPVGK